MNYIEKSMALFYGDNFLYKPKGRKCKPDKYKQWKHVTIYIEIIVRTCFDFQVLFKFYARFFVKKSKVQTQRGSNETN